MTEKQKIIARVGAVAEKVAGAYRIASFNIKPPPGTVLRKVLEELDVAVEALEQERNRGRSHAQKG